MTLFLLSGSPRPYSAVSHLLRAAAALAPAGTTRVFYESVLALPLFDPGQDVTSAW